MRKLLTCFFSLSSLLCSGQIGDTIQNIVWYHEAKGDTLYDADLVSCNCQEDEAFAIDAENRRRLRYISRYYFDSIDSTCYKVMLIPYEITYCDTLVNRYNRKLERIAPLIWKSNKVNQIQYFPEKNVFVIYRKED